MKDISIESPSLRFETHLSLEKNFRIIFSGRFGIGKTFFLNNFFDSRDKQYNKILISPVNYAISSNENIFELIKADILKELFLTGKIELEKITGDSTLQKISNYYEENPFVLSNFMIKSLTKLNPAIETPIKLLTAIFDIIDKYKKNVTKNPNEDTTLSEDGANYLNETEQKIGSIYEYNYITKAINIFLQEIKKSKKNVLILDDLDRLDPDHIFRILNILSAHNNSFDEGNKFNFDHIIIVCDINNIKKIFAHKYGQEVDFDGYIDKFYSTDIFQYSNIDAVKDYIKDVFAPSQDNADIKLANITLQTILNIPFLNVRNLLKHRYTLDIPEFKLKKPSTQNITRWPGFIEGLDNIYISSMDLLILRFFKLMSFVYGSFDAFYAHLSELNKITDEIDYTEYSIIAAFLALQSHIVSSDINTLFFSNQRQNASSEGFDYPETKFMNKQYRIVVRWTYQNKYKPDKSYFENAKIFEIEPNRVLSNVQTIPPITMKVSGIFECIKGIALACQSKGYLEKAGMVLTTPNIQPSF